MPLNRDFIGRVFPAEVTYEVGREAIWAFAQAIGDTNPLYLDAEAARAAGHPNVIAPPTFLIAMNKGLSEVGPISDPDFGLDFSLVVHGEQRFTLHRPVVAGDVLSATSSVVEVRDVGPNELAGIVQEITDAGGQPVASLYVSLISRGTAAPKES